MRRPRFYECLACFLAMAGGCVPELQRGVPPEMDLPIGFLEESAPSGPDRVGERAPTLPIPSTPAAAMPGVGLEARAAEPHLFALAERDHAPAAAVAKASTPEGEERLLLKLDPERVLVSTSSQTPVYRAPSFSSAKIGYLRSGAVVSRATEPSAGKGCSEGFYEVAPAGFVCVGRSASLDAQHPLVQIARVRPARAKGLPYEYGRAANQATAIYNGIPTPEEQEALNGPRLGQAPSPEWKTSHLSAVPEFLKAQRYSVGSNGERRQSTSIGAGRSVRDGGFALLEMFESDGRYFGLSTDFDVLPLAGLKRVAPSTFRGLVLGPDAELPVAFVRSAQAYLYRGDAQRGLEPERPIRFREGFAMTGSKERIDGRLYHETRDGYWILDSGRLVVIEAMQEPPSWASAGRTWMDVSILKQTLVAYEGTRALYATLVSTGADGVGDPESTHATVQGQYLIHTKHVSTRMKGDEPGDEFDLRDVPYVQYFNEGYALHGAYWHDSFGTPRSHGCINLSPEDAQWLFEWTDPHVPREWHGAMSLRDGTLVSIHP